MQIGCTTFLPGTAHSFNSLTRYEAALLRGREVLETRESPGIEVGRPRMERRPLNLPDAVSHHPPSQGGFLPETFYPPLCYGAFFEILIGFDTLL